jgi:hypothetical protein
LPASNAINIPSNALLIRKEGTQVAIVDEQNKVHLQKIKLGRDFGVSSDVIEGLKGGEKLVLNPSDSLSEGQMLVTVVADEVKPEALNAAASPQAQQTLKRPSHEKVGVDRFIVGGLGLLLKSTKIPEKTQLDLRCRV